jgi:RNA recognition motif-containing protein
MKDERKLENKGYAFVIFTTKESALKAIKGLKDMEWKVMRTILC